MSIQTLQNNKKLYKFTYKEDEKKQLIKMMIYNGDLLFNGILPLDLEVKILKINGYIYDYDTQEIIKPSIFLQIENLPYKKYNMYQQKQNYDEYENKGLDTFNEQYYNIDMGDTTSSMKIIEDKNQNMVINLHKTRNIIYDSDIRLIDYDTFSTFYLKKKSILIRKKLLVEIIKKYNMESYMYNAPYDTVYKGASDYEIHDVLSIGKMVDVIKEFLKEWKNHHIIDKTFNHLKKIKKTSTLDQLYKILISDN